MIITEITQEELIELAQKMLDSGTEEEGDKLYSEFNSHFSHPDTANLFYYPENYNHRTDWDKIGEYDPSIEEVIQIGKNHKPITPIQL